LNYIINITLICQTARTIGILSQNTLNLRGTAPGTGLQPDTAVFITDAMFGTEIHYKEAIMKKIDPDSTNDTCSALPDRSPYNYWEDIRQGLEEAADGRHRSLEDALQDLGRYRE